MGGEGYRRALYRGGALELWQTGGICTPCRALRYRRQGEPRRTRNSAHIALVTSKPCLACGRNLAQAHHFKIAQLTALGP